MKTIAEIEAIRKETLENINLRKDSNGYRVVVAMATCGIAAGARPVMTAVLDELAKRNLSDVTVTQSGCIGDCANEPIVMVCSPEGEKTTYVKMNPEKVAKIVEEHIENGRVVADYTIGAAK